MTYGTSHKLWQHSHRAVTKPDALAVAIGPSALSLTLVLGLIDTDKLYVTICLLTAMCVSITQPMATFSMTSFC